MSQGRGKSRRDKETNPSVYNKLKRELLRCPLCPPNRGEKRKSHKKHVTKLKRK